MSSWRCWTPARRQGYSSSDTGLGADNGSGEPELMSLKKYMLQKGDMTPNTSARQELIEHLINRFI